MTPSPRLWFATFAALVFLIGALAGVVVDRTLLVPRSIGTPGGFGQGRGMGPGGGLGLGPGRGGGPLLQGPERVVTDLDTALDLSAEQETAIRKILEDWRPRVQDLQNTARSEYLSAQEQLHAEIAKTLTADQAKRFQELSAPLLEGGRGPRGGGLGRRGRQ
jgi:uncharacterized membrane protein